jgi:hypothetical protein
MWECSLNDSQSQLGSPRQAVSQNAGYSPLLATQLPACGKSPENRKNSVRLTSIAEHAPHDDFDDALVGNIYS